MNTKKQNRMTKEINDEKKFVAVREVARRWQVSEKKVRRLIANGRLPAYRIGGQVRIGEVDLVAFEQACRIAPRDVPDVQA